VKKRRGEKKNGALHHHQKTKERSGVLAAGQTPVPEKRGGKVEIPHGGKKEKKQGKPEQVKKREKTFFHQTPTERWAPSPRVEKRER